MIKNEPEDEDSNSDSEVRFAKYTRFMPYVFCVHVWLFQILIKSEPASPRNMEVDVEPTMQMLETLKDLEFSDECIKLLSELLDGTETLQNLAKVIEFDAISLSLKTISTKMVLNYANVS